MAYVRDNPPVLRVAVVGSYESIERQHPRKSVSQHSVVAGGELRQHVIDHFHGVERPFSLFASWNFLEQLLFVHIEACRGNGRSVAVVALPGR